MSGLEAIFCGRSRDPLAARPRSADRWLVKRRIDEGCSARWNPGMGGTNRSRGEVFWDSRRGTDLPVAELLATCAMRLGAVRFAVLQRNVNHGFTIAVTTRDHLVLLGVYGLAVRKHRLSNDRAAVASTSTRFSPKTFPKGVYNLADYER